MPKQMLEKIKVRGDVTMPVPGAAILDEINRLEVQIRGLSHRITIGRCGPDTSAAKIRSILRARQERREHFSAHLFADPAWDILLELYALELEQRRVSVSKLCLSAGVPSTTALRWIEKLHDEGLISRGEDPFDGRRIWVSLSHAGKTAMQRYFDGRAGDALPI